MFNPSPSRWREQKKSSVWRVNEWDIFSQKDEKYQRKNSTIPKSPKQINEENSPLGNS